MTEPLSLRAAVAPPAPKFVHSAVPFTQVALQDGLWSKRQESVRRRTIPFLYAKMVENGLIEALDVDLPPGPLRIPFNGRPSTAVMYWDSDLAKWIEAASYVLASNSKNPETEARIDDIVARIIRAQRPDGYFNSYFIRREPKKRWTNLRDWHELYCAGHLIEAAVAHFLATGKTELLDAMRRYADYIATVFGPNSGQLRGYCGHPEIELALVKLYRLTGEQQYLDLAAFFVDERGRQPHYFDQEALARRENPADQYHRTYEYNQSHVPLREQTQVVGHAVRAMYLYCAAADLAGERNDAGLLEACRRLWADLTGKRLYVTGGLGPSASNEGFTTDFDLPNETAYAETCAAVGLVFWAHRMLLVERDGRYADMMELALYNGALSGISLDGERFFYDNPLASRGGHHRWTWHRCPCCPANVARLIASLGQYVYSVGGDELAVHLYVESRAEMSVGGTRTRLQQKTRYPWDGGIEVTVDPDGPARFTLALRIPAWCRKARLAINGASIDLGSATDRGYVRVDRVWQPGDRVSLDLHMPAERVYANPEVRADAGRVALKRGPLVYCVEAPDQSRPIHNLVLPRDRAIEARFESGLLGGVVTLAAEAAAVAAPADLYRAEPPTMEPATLRAVPYHVWDHRDPGEMAVWIREI
ncbi:MAG: glycoside hydrolase family 127 protein [Propylenella sp.]